MWSHSLIEPEHPVQFSLFPINEIQGQGFHLLSVDCDAFSDRLEILESAQALPSQRMQLGELNKVHRRLRFYVGVTGGIGDERDGVNASLVFKRR